MVPSSHCKGAGEADDKSDKEDAVHLSEEGMGVERSRDHKMIHRLLRIGLIFEKPEPAC